MNHSNLIIYIFEMIGTVAFASSGALVGIRKNMDIFGVNVLGITTAVGGGCIRDIILGITPPKMFQNFSYVGASILISCILFTIFYLNQELLSSRFLETYERVMISLDAIGLGVFTVMGIRTAIEASFENNIFLLIFVGAVTGIGGGMLRDVMAGMTPFVFVKHVYAIAFDPRCRLLHHPAPLHPGYHISVSQRCRSHHHPPARRAFPLESPAHTAKVIIFLLLSERTGHTKLCACPFL